MNRAKVDYHFGDSDLAADRLRHLAEVFEPSTREFLGQLRVPSGARIADLGCGPGHTTRLLAEVFPTASARGFDKSKNFISLARAVAGPRVAFEVADVTVSLPGGPYELVYCRYLLTHVPDFRGAVALWSQQLAPGGRIAIEENEWIHTEEPAFSRYLSIVSAMLADAGQRLYVGAELGAIDNWPHLARAASELVAIGVSTRVAAGMFLPNLEIWRTADFVQKNYQAKEIDALKSDLEKLAEDPDLDGAITFGRRRLLLSTRSAASL
jgi:trans-aconitate methyltransferase